MASKKVPRKDKLNIRAEKERGQVQEKKGSSGKKAKQSKPSSAREKKSKSNKFI